MVDTLPLVIIAFATVAVVATSAARATSIPYPVVLVLVGLVLGLLPGVPSFTVPPDVVFLVFLPPLVYGAAFAMPPEELRTEWRPLATLAIGLVVLGAAAVAVVSHLAAGLTLALAATLGTIVSPTDPVAPVAIMRRLGAPGRVSTIIEGEGLVNDGVALVLYGSAVEVVTGHGFSLPHVALRFLTAVVVGVAVGLAAGWLAGFVRSRIDDSPVEIGFSLLVPYLAYLPAERLHGSGVLAAVAAGLYTGRREARLFSGTSRLASTAFWDAFEFLLNAALFLLVGLSFPAALDAAHGWSARLTAHVAVVCAAVIGCRMVWMLAVPPLFHVLTRGSGPSTLRQRLVLGWAGMRGAVSLAAALALPVLSGERERERAEVLVLTSMVIVATLVVQGASLPFVLRALGLQGQEPAAGGEREARLKGARAALEHLDEIAARDELPEDVVDALALRYQLRIDHLQSERDVDADEDRLQVDRRLQRELLEIERRTVIALREQGRITGRELRAVEHDLDLEEARLG